MFDQSSAAKAWWAHNPQVPRIVTSICLPFVNYLLYT